jgi:hypothetical protein
MPVAHQRVGLVLVALLAGVLCGCGGGGGGGGGSSDGGDGPGFRVLETTPFWNELAVARDTVLTVTFSERIHPATIAPDSFKLREQATGQAVRGEVTVSDDERTVTLSPSSLLRLATPYVLRVGREIESRFGERMSEDFETMFTTVISETDPPPPPPPDQSGHVELIGAMWTGRSSHTATRLASGWVLVTGGFATSSVLTATAEVYNPSTRVFNQLSSGLRIARAHHRATLLKNGKVLITGGVTDSGTTALASTELYDPVLGSFSYGPSMSQARAYHTATLLEDGRVLVTCGAYTNQSGHLINSRTAEIYDPETNAWSSLPDLTVYRSDHTATLLLDGRVLIAGGSSTSKTGELFDPDDGTFGAVNGEMIRARSQHTATRLIGGQVLLVGGTMERSAELYTPGILRFESTQGIPFKERVSHTANLLTTGRVLIVGGYSWNDFTFHVTYEWFNGPPGNKSFTFAQALFTFPRVSHRSTVLADGDILYTGGINLDPTLPEYAAVELYTFK